MREDGNAVIHRHPSGRPLVDNRVGVIHSACATGVVRPPSLQPYG